MKTHSDETLSGDSIFQWFEGFNICMDIKILVVDSLCSNEKSLLDFLDFILSLEIIRFKQYQ